MNDIMRMIISKIKTKKLKNIDDKIILSKIGEFLKKEPRIVNKFSSLTEKSADFKKVVKYAKQALYPVYGAFQQDIAKRERLLAQLKTTSDSKQLLELHKNILLTHTSTAERLPFYPTLYDKLFAITGKPKIIFDLGCGLNPFSLPWISLDEVKYIAAEFNEQDTKFIADYFDIIKKGNFETMTIDITKEFAKLKEIKADVVFAWKLFDIIDTKTVENIVKNLNAKFLIASFSTKTLGKKQMTFPRRSGFQKMLRRLNLEYQTKAYQNELFYIIQLK